MNGTNFSDARRDRIYRANATHEGGRHTAPLPQRSPMSGLIVILAFAALVAGAAPALAGPTWWSGTCAEAKRLARQTNRWMFLYFESPNAINCQRLDEETWPKINPETAEKNYIWIRLNQADHAKFFTHFEVYSAPELIVVDQDGNERSRLRGFVDPRKLMTMLDKVFQSAASEKRVMLNDGTIMSVADYQKTVDENRLSHASRHFYYQGFDDAASKDFRAGGPWSFPVAGSSRIEPAEGLYHSGCLYVGSDQARGAAAQKRPAAQARLNLGAGSDGRALGQVDSGRGKLRLSMTLRAVSMPEKLTEIARVSVVPRGADPDSPEAAHFTTTLSARETQWLSKFIETDTFNFVEKDVYLTLWVDQVGHGFYVEDLQADIVAEGQPNVTQADQPRDRNPLAALEAVSASKSEGDRIFKSFDKNKDGRLEWRELTENGRAVFGVYLQGRPYESADLDRDGFIDVDEWRKLTGLFFNKMELTASAR